MRYAKLFAGALLALSASAASAETFTINLNETSEFGNAFTGTSVGQTFLDIYNFSFTSQSDVGSAVTSFALRTKYDLNITSFDLYSATGLAVGGTREMTGALDLWTLSSNGLSSGNYSLRVGGTILGSSGGSYGGNINVSPVPEPETWSMMGVGLAVAGVMARRRKSSRRPSSRAA